MVDEPVADLPRKFAAGRDISRLPAMRLARARGLIAELVARIDIWIASGHLTGIAELDATGTRIEMRLRVSSPPPIDEWTMDLGEGIHQLRASLDALVWDLAHVDGAQPEKPGQIYFPIKASPADFDKAVEGSLKTVPPDAIERLRLLQPYQQSPEPGTPFLKLLHDLDISDKHRGLIAGWARFGGGNLHGITWDGRRFSPDEVSRIQIRMVPTPVELEDGAYIGAIVLPQALRADEFTTTPFQPHVDFYVTRDEHTVPFSDIVNKFPGLTETVHQVVLQGAEFADAGSAWHDIEVVDEPLD